MSLGSDANGNSRLEHPFVLVGWEVGVECKKSVMVTPTGAERLHIEHEPRGVRPVSNYAMVLDAASVLLALIWTNMMSALEMQGTRNGKSSSTKRDDGKNMDISSRLTGEGGCILGTTREDPKDC